MKLGTLTPQSLITGLPASYCVVDCANRAAWVIKPAFQRRSLGIFKLNKMKKQKVKKIVVLCLFRYFAPCNIVN